MTEEESSLEEDDVYEVEKIVKHRKHSGRIQYRVRWKGYTEDDDTWEDEDNLEGCAIALAEYHKAHPNLVKKDEYRQDESDEPDVEILEVKALPKEKGRSKKASKERYTKLQEAAMRLPIARPKIPFSTHCPDVPIDQPIPEILSGHVLQNTFVYRIRRNKMDPEFVTSESLRMHFPETLIAFWENQEKSLDRT